MRTGDLTTPFDDFEPFAVLDAKDIFKVAQYLAVRPELLPRNPNGKVLNGVVRDETGWGAPLR